MIWLNLLSININISQYIAGGHTIKCVYGDCERVIPIERVREHLRPDTISELLKRAQRDELRRAALDDVQECPFCEFAAVIEDSNDRIFRCMNQQCLKESCRLVVSLI